MYIAGVDAVALVMIVLFSNMFLPIPENTLLRNQPIRIALLFPLSQIRMPFPHI
jgi:hypothetical protein